MSTIPLSTAKARLRIIHTADDADLQVALDGAEDEALRFMNRERLPTLPLEYPPAYDSSSSEVSEETPSSEDPVAPSVIEAVLLLVKASYEATTPAEIMGYRQAAEHKLMPYRTRLGV